MLNTIKDSPRLFIAELQKLKNTPSWYLILVGALFTATIVFVGHLLDAHNMVKLNNNPWERYFQASIAVFSIFLLVPFLVLFLTSSTYIEQKASAWKYLYTLPYRRGQIFFAKLFSIITLLLLSILLMLAALVLSAYCLNFFKPAYEFTYYSPDLASIFSDLSHLAIASFGLIGLQYLFCLVFKNFLIPLGIGIFGFITSMILSLTGSSIACYSPYAYPMLVKDLQMFKHDHITESIIPGLNNIECYSLLYFGICVLLAYIYECRRNVTN